MTGNFTFTMIKPTAVANGHIGPILNMISENGFHITALKMLQLTIKDAENFYAVHKGKPFYPGLIDFMSSGPIVAAILEKENAVEEYRKLIGSTDPEKAEEGTLRKIYAVSIQENAVHGSDSDENATIEAAFFFSSRERFRLS
ncbi:MAG: nucleoside-diphosphate kinase [Bacteroidales bacterium]